MTNNLVLSVGFLGETPSVWLVTEHECAFFSGSTTPFMRLVSERKTKPNESQPDKSNKRMKFKKIVRQSAITYIAGGRQYCQIWTFIKRNLQVGPQSNPLLSMYLWRLSRTKRKDFLLACGFCIARHPTKENSSSISRWCINF